MKISITATMQYPYYCKKNLPKLAISLICLGILIGGGTHVSAGAKTCGTCHGYKLITKGFHFQQGWENISDTFDKKNTWILSDGMMGKH